MQRFNVPTREDVNENNQKTFDALKGKLGFVPNLYAYYAKHDNALNDFLAFSSRRSTLSNKEQEVVNLAVSQYNGCTYCQSAHTAIAGMNGFTSDQILELRKGEASFDDKLDALAKFSVAIVAGKGHVSNEDKEAFFSAGYTESDLVDLVLTIGAKTISNFIHNIADFAIDFPLAPSLELQDA